MDVGNPSNFARMKDMMPGVNAMNEKIEGYSFTDEETKEAMKLIHSKYGYISDPHGAVGYLGLQSSASLAKTNCIFLETAHPAKFTDVVEPVLNTQIPLPERLEKFMKKEKHSIKIENKFEQLKDFLLQRKIVAILFLFFVLACNRGEEKADAFGNFEATEVIVSAEATGNILKLDVEEGQHLDSGQVVGLIDTTQLFLKAQQLIAAKNAVATKSTNISAQMKVLQEQRKNLLRDEQRFENLVKEEALPQKQLDDIRGQINVVEQQVKSVESQYAPIAPEINAIDAQLKQVRDQVRNSVIRNPVGGTVLTKYAEEAEVTAYGRPLYKIANLDTMILRVYISGAQLSSIRIGQEVNVFFDAGTTANAELPGKITWIASTAEFTPKIIQTKEERVNLVYAVKVKVRNDGSLKIGMPGEVRWPKS
jgi:HlyD family secretion protein